VTWSSPIGKFQFIENRGQWPSKVGFRAQIGSHRVWLENQRITYELIRAGLHPLAQIHAQRFHEEPDTSKFLAHVFRVNFENANLVKPQASSAQEKTKYNFYLGKDREKWATGASSYSSIVYKNLYPGISLSIHSGDQFLKYDFEMAAGQNGTAISLLYEGDQGLQIKEGRLRIRTSLGVVEEHIPKAYQLVNGVSKEVECYYVLSGKKVGFRFSKPLDPRYPTIIDPLLNFLTYSGSTSDNWANTAVSDRDGFSYTAGTVYGSIYPTTSGAYDRSFNGATGQNRYLTYDIGILKFNQTGNQLLSCSFLGGSGAETPHSLEVDEAQNLVIMGTTSSGDFPVSVSAFQQQFKGGPVEYPFGYSETSISPTYTNGSDIFITKLSSGLQSIVASTYLGGTGTDGLMTVYENLVTNYGDQFRGDLLVDSDGSIFVASHTHSSDFPIVNPSQSSLGGNMDGLLVKFNSNLSEVSWSTYFGGSSEDAIFSLKFQGASRLVVCGGTNSTDMRMPAVTYQKTRNGKSIDGFVACFEKVTGDWVSSTYSGSASYDQAYLVETDDERSVFIFGQTQGVMPKSPNTFGNNRGGQFLQKFSSDLKSLSWSTTYGTTPSRPNIVPTSFMVDSCGRIYMAGWGGKVNNQEVEQGFAGGYTYGLPVSNDAFQSVSQDSSDFYFLILTRDAKSILFGTYLGSGKGRGEHVDGGTSRFDKRGVITQAICGCKDNNDQYFKGTINSYQPNIGSNNCNNGVMKINLFDLKVKFNFAGAIKCPSTITLTNQSENGEFYTWLFGNGDSLQSNTRTVNYTYSSPGKYIITLKAINTRTCVYQAVAIDSITIPDPFNLPASYPVDSFCVGDTIRPIFNELEPYSIQWKPQNYLSDPTSYKPVITPLGSLRYTIEVKNQQGCIAKIDYGLQNRKINLGFGTEKTYLPCDGIYKIKLFSNKDSSERYKWTFGNGDTASGPVVFRTYSRNGRYPVQLNGIKGNCEENAFDTLDLNDQKITILPSFTTSRLYEGCDQPYIVFTNTTRNGHSFIWDFDDGFKTTEINPRHRYEKAGTYEVKLEGYKDNCREVYIKKIVIDEFYVPNLITLNDDLKNDLFTIRGLQPDWGLEIYNRWGSQVFETSVYKNDWKPAKVEEGVYFYNILFPGGNHCNSWFQVVKN